ncbi:MAG: ABC transporter permease [Gemmatimonadaceae bacterium]|nr:ABC transporter permease [Gemmatimonadaceae bacterium]
MRSPFRSLIRHPASSAAGALMGAIGIALLTLGFAVIDAAIWRPLPVSNAREALVLYTSYTSAREVRPEVRWSFPRLQYVREHATTVDRVTAFTTASLTLTGRDEPEMIAGEFVGGEYFALLGVAPLAGRGFAADEDVPGAPRAVALVSAAFQSRRRLLGDSAVIGATIRLNAQPVTIIGVMPPSFRGLSGAADVWLPTAMAPILTYPEYLTTAQDFISVLARRVPGRSLEKVQGEISALAAAAQRAFPSDDAPSDGSVSGLAKPLGTARVRPDGSRAATLALAGSALLFLLTLANLVALLLGRVVARRGETAVTIAIGAPRARVWRANARDGVVLVSIAAALALAGVATWFRIAGPLDPLASVGRGTFATFSAVTPGWRVAGWWLVASAFALAGAATIPAWYAVRHSALDHLHDGAHSSAASGMSLRRPGVAAAILAIESALAMVLVVAAGQLLESYRRLQGVDVGVDPTHVLTFELHPPESRVPPEAAPRFIHGVLESVRLVPGVIAASVDGGAPLAGSASAELKVVGRPDDPVTGAPIGWRHYVGPEHFETLGIPVRAGRALTPADRVDAPRVVVISESAARQYFPAGDAIGQRVWFDGSSLSSPDSSAEIVGIVGDVKYDSPISERTTASFYTPYAQFTYGWRVYFVRVAGAPRAMVRGISDAVHRVAPDLPLRNVRPLEEILSSSRAAPRSAARGTGVLALLGLLLATCGTWAVVSHATARQSRNVAIRLAHGATPGRVVRMILRDGLVWPVLGTVAGAVLAVAFSGALRALLYDVAPGEPRIVAGAALVFVLVAGAACLLPAWRASRIEPIEALRAD